MYQTGTQFNFENRLHQLPDTSGDLKTYWSEFLTYTGIVSGAGQYDKITREFEKKYYDVNPIFYGVTGVSGIGITSGANYVFGILV